MQGQKNSSLNEIGRLQAETHGRLLAGFGIDAIYASPLERARETAAIVTRHVDRGVAFDQRIVEWDCGEWSGRLRTEVRKRWPQEWAALEADPYHYRGPGCENYPDMIERARPFVDDLRASADRAIAVISHGMIGRVMVGILMSFDEAAMLAYRQPNDVVYRIRIGPEAGNRSGRAVLDHFVGLDGPYDGVVPR